jgi:hypothetical protein
MDNSLDAKDVTARYRTGSFVVLSVSFVADVAGGAGTKAQHSRTGTGMCEGIASIQTASKASV